MIKSYITIVLAFVATFIVLHVLFGTLDGTIKTSQTAPFNTIVEYFCSKAGTEYLITQNNAVALHIDSQGMPVLCTTQEPLAGE